jgi:hypothetical protein
MIGMMEFDAVSILYIAIALISLIQQQLGGVKQGLNDLCHANEGADEAVEELGI